MGVVGEQHQRGKRGRADCVAFGYGFGRVADRVELVGDLADFRWQIRHFSDAAGVVSNRPERIKRYNHTGHRQHRRRGNGDVVKAGQ